MFAGSMCCKVRVILALGVTPAPVLRVNPHPADCMVGYRAPRTQADGVKVLTWLKLETQPKLDTEYSLCHFVFPFTNINPPPIAVCLFLPLSLKPLLFTPLGHLDYLYFSR